MKRWSKGMAMTMSAGVIGLTFSGTVYATPSTLIWGPSTDIQPFKVVHLTHDVYAPTSKDAADNRVPPAINLGLEVGVLPFEKLMMEVGFDVIQIGGAADSNPLFYNVKLGTPENSLMQGFPALAVGSYLLGGKKDLSNAEVVYGRIAKTFGPIGRLSAGYYTGNDKVLLDETGEDAADGVMVAWEKTVSEISDKLWVCVEYMGGESFLGTTNVAFAWAFTPSISVLFGYDMLNNQDLTGVANTFTTQLDLNF